MTQRGARYVVILLALACASAASAADRDGDAACLPAKATAAVQVRFQDRAVSRDDSRSISELRALSQTPANRYHHVLGLTQAIPQANLQVKALTWQNARGAVCAVPEINLELGFSVLSVYLANDIKDACRRAVVVAHDDAHVRVWRDHLRASASIMQSLLLHTLGAAQEFTDALGAKEAVQRRADAAVADLLARTQAGILVSQREIDTPAAYQVESGRILACP